MTGEELRPCPFCGSSAELRISESVPRTFGCRIACPTCAFKITREGSDIDAATIRMLIVAAWNRRPAFPSPDPRDAIIEELRGALEEMHDSACTNATSTPSKKAFLRAGRALVMARAFIAKATAGQP
jgi:hypothetical protein